MYNFIMAGISAGTAVLDGKVGTAVSVKMGGIDVIKGQLTHPEDNHYEAIGRLVGDSIGVIGSMILGGKMKNLTVQQKAIGAFGTSQAVAEIGFGDIFANLFNTYVANADAFYEKILADANFASKTWSGIVENGLNNYVNYFDPDGDGSVSALDIINGYKELFSPPPAFGTAEFELQYSVTDKSHITIITENEEAQQEAIKEIIKYDEIQTLTLNSQLYGLVTKESIEGLIGTDAEAWEAFLEANPWLQVAEDYLLFDYSKELIFPEDILPESSAGHNENFSSPLVLDLNANGTTSTFIAQSETYFDMDGDGFKERTSWSESTDGLLTLDKNQDGIINNGSELFGNYTKLANGTLAKNGFEALSQYDLNKDNIIDNKDSIYTHLKVWSDTNSDGISISDELKTLQELNISKINLASTKTSTSEAYNKISDSSTFTQNDETKTIFTCKPFTTQKALHVKTNTKPKEEDNGLYQEVA